MDKNNNFSKIMAKRFRGFYPIVIDIETGGLNPLKDAMLEIAAVSIGIDSDGKIYPAKQRNFHIEPFKGANLDRKALEFNKIDPYHPFRFAVSEEKMFDNLIPWVLELQKNMCCSRSVLVGHNAWFDLHFLNAALNRCKIKSPFHSFTCFDTATLAAAAYGQTVLAKAAKCANIKFNTHDAHSAKYDAEKTAELFCKIINNW